MISREKTIRDALEKAEAWFNAVFETYEKNKSKNLNEPYFEPGKDMVMLRRILTSALTQADEIKDGPSEEYNKLKDKKWMETLGRLVNRNMRGPDRFSRDAMTIKWAHDKLKSGEMG